MCFNLIKVGRGEDNNIVLGQGQISTHHVEFLLYKENRFFLTDLNLRNGA